MDRSRPRDRSPTFFAVESAERCIRVEHEIGIDFVRHALTQGCGMYRIELAPGEETVFRTIEELAIGVRNGLVTARSRIFHSASQKWLPIEFHPHYKKALELSSHRQDVPTTKIPERLESLNFAVPRPPAPPETPAPPVTQSPPETPAPSATQAPPPPPPQPPRPPAPEPIAPAPVRMAPVSLVRADAMPVRVVVESPEPEESHPVHLPLVIQASTALEDEPIAEKRAAASASLPPVVASPVLQFPAIVYPEITPAEPPVAEPATESARSRRPLHIIGAIAVLALGGYGMLSFAPSRGDAEPVPAPEDRPALPEPMVQAPVDQPVPNTPPRTSSKPVVMTQPASSGFAPALEPRAIVSTSTATAGATPPAPAAIKDSSLAPAPIDIQLDVPALPGAESLVATPQPKGDSAMKRILRAVNGGKDLPQRP
jgi:hypothetical protein